MANVAILIPAAGFSRRMAGGDKLLETIEGEPLLRRTARRALAVSRHVLVTLRADAPARLKALDGLSVRPVLVPDAASGLSASLRRGVAALDDDADAVLVLPADMPDLTAEDLETVLTAHGKGDPAWLVQATSEAGKPGHPVLFPKACFGEFATLHGDYGAREILARRRDQLVHVPLAGNRALTDLDTPDDWARWRTAKDR